MKSKNTECCNKGKGSTSFILWDTPSIMRAAAWETWETKLHKEHKWPYNLAMALVSMVPRLNLSLEMVPGSLNAQSEK